MKVSHGPKSLTIELETRFKDKRHRAEFKRLLDVDLVEAVQYAKSFNGVKVRIPSVRDERSKIDSVNDLLALKSTGSIVQLYHHMFDAEANHKPLNIGLGEWIGVEIECCIPYDKSHVLFERNGIHVGPDTTFCDPGEGCNECCDDEDCESDHCEGHEGEDSSDTAWRKALGEFFEAKKIKRVSVKDDGSIDAEDGCFGVEVTILFLKNNREPLKQLCNALSDLGAEVNRSCGMHVHLDQRGRTLQKVKARANALGLALPLLASMVPKSRRRNNYCKLAVSSLSGSERYYAINCTAFEKYKTIEVRLHSATRDFDKISNWIDLLLLIQDAETGGTYGDGEWNNISSLSDLAMAINVPERLIKYVEARISRFSNDDANEQAGQDTQTAEVAA
jgi:hypothetical protein